MFEVVNFNKFFLFPGAPPILIAKSQLGKLSNDGLVTITYVFFFNYYYFIIIIIFYLFIYLF